MRWMVLALLLAGCSLMPRPALQVPDRPEIMFYGIQGGVCISSEDAQELLIYMRSIDALSNRLQPK